MEKTNETSVFNTLNPINVNEHKEKRASGNGIELDYLSWPWAWAEVKKRYPDAVYSIYRDEKGRPYVEDEQLGMMCFTTVTICGQTLEMWLPVMNGANKAMRRTEYTYDTWNKHKNCYEKAKVNAVTMFDVNKTIMRCLVKNLAMFGLGLYIYSGEDLPESETEDRTPEQPAKSAEPKKPAQSAPKSKGNVIIPKKEEKAAAEAKKAEKAAQAADDRNRPWTEREHAEYEQALIDMDNAANKEQLITTFTMFKDAIYNMKLLAHAGEVCKRHGWPFEPKQQ